jgi:hypothetical protein
MESITHILETRNGINIVRNFFVYPNEGNLQEVAQRFFNKDQKKEAKLNYKNSLKNQSVHKTERMNLIEYLIKQPFPNWNIKVSIL